MSEVCTQEVQVGAASGVVLGEQGQASFTLVNEGALEVQFEITSSANQVSSALFSYLAQLKDSHKHCVPAA